MYITVEYESGLTNKRCASSTNQASLAKSSNYPREIQGYQQPKLHSIPAGTREMRGYIERRKFACFAKAGPRRAEDIVIVACVENPFGV